MIRADKFPDVDLRLSLVGDEMRVVAQGTSAAPLIALCLPWPYLVRWTVDEALAATKALSQTARAGRPCFRLLPPTPLFDRIAVWTASPGLVRLVLSADRGWAVGWPLTVPEAHAVAQAVHHATGAGS